MEHDTKTCQCQKCATYRVKGKRLMRLTIRLAEKLSCSCETGKCVSCVAKEASKYL